MEKNTEVNLVDTLHEAAELLCPKDAQKTMMDRDPHCVECRHCHSVAYQDVIDKLLTVPFDALHYIEHHDHDTCHTCHSVMDSGIGGQQLVEYCLHASDLMCESNLVSWIAGDARLGDESTVITGLIKVVMCLLPHLNKEDLRQLDQTSIYQSWSDTGIERWIAFLTNHQVVPTQYCYRDYGWREDRTYQQKMKMFKFFQLYKVAPDNPGWGGTRLADCTGMSTNLEDVKSLFVYFHQLGLPFDGLTLTNSFGSWGTQLLTFLQQQGCPPPDSFFSIVYRLDRDRDIPKHSHQERVNVIKQILQLYPIQEWGQWVSSSMVSELINLDSYDILEQVDPFVRQFSKDNLRRYLFGWGTSLGDTLPSLWTCVKCVHFLLQKEYLDIPTGDYMNARTFYRFKGKLFDQLLKKEPKLQQALKVHPELDGTKVKAKTSYTYDNDDYHEDHMDDDDDYYY
jgi:hypothetical protein